VFFKKKEPYDYIIVGLGNPGKEYERTRHNAGFMTLDILAEKHKIKVDRLRFKALTGDGVIGDKRVFLIKPQTFMNLSGFSVSQAAMFYKIPMSRVLVIFDDVSLPLGKIRIRKQGSSGGHNGIKSIISSCATEEFPRVKIGIGAPDEREMIDWVIGRFSADEMKTAEKAFSLAAEAVEYILSRGEEAAINAFNGKTAN